MVYRLLQRCLDHLLPQHCRLCGAGQDMEQWLCRHCHAELPWMDAACCQCAAPLPVPDNGTLCGHCQRHAPAFDVTRAAFHYQPPLDYLLKRLKFSAELPLGQVLGELFVSRLEPADRSLPRQLVPVPLHPARLRERGYNQAEELARTIGRELQIPLAGRLCRRVRHTTAQSLLPLTARRLNLRQAFEITARPAGHVAIVDDVMTSGHTVNELARVLKLAGASTVEVWVIARAGQR